MEQNQIAQLNFEPLRAAVTSDMRSQFIARYPKYPKVSGAFMSTLLIAYLIGISIMVMIMLISNTFNLSLVVIGLIMGGVVGSLHYFWKKHVDGLIKMTAFADANSLVYKFNVNDPKYPGLIFDEGHSRNIVGALVFPEYEVGNYQYVTGSGKNQQTHNFGYVRLTLKRPIPHMVLDAKKNDLFGMFSNLPVSFNSSQTLELEGDFSKYFTLYVPEKYERDSLYILTPDVMASLIDESSTFDLEAVGTELYLYRTSHFDLSSPIDLGGVAKHILELNAEFVEQASGYSDERVGASVQAVAAGGARLKRRIHPLTIVIGVFVIGYVLVSYIIPLIMYLGS